MSFDGAVGALSSVDDGHQWWGEIFDEPCVVGGGFFPAPIPGDDVGWCAGDQKAAAGGVGAVEEDLVVDAWRSMGWGDPDEPVVLHLAVHRGGANANGLRQLGDGCFASAMIDKQAEPLGCGDVLAAFGVGGAAVSTAPSGGACAGQPIFTSLVMCTQGIVVGFPA